VLHGAPIIIGFLTTIGLISMSKQIIMVGLEDLVPADHIYRRFSALWKFEGAQSQLKNVEKDNNYKG